MIATLTGGLVALVLLPAPPAAPVVVEHVATDEVTDRVDALGTLKANESVTLSATITDSISAIHFDDGQRVAAGAILVELTSAEERASLAAARSTEAEALRQLERVKSLVDSGAVSQAAYDQRRREHETAKARLAGIRSQLRDHLVVAPFSGVVGLRNLSVGALVRPGDELTTLDDDSIMKLDFSIPETRLALVQVGMKIRARTTGRKGREFAGEVRSIDSRIDPATRSIVVRAVIPNPEPLLRPGQLMTVELFGPPRTSIVISEEALVPEGKKHYVFVVAPGEEEELVARRREVRIGTRLKGRVEIAEGLVVGERVVTHGTLRVRDGSAVKIQSTPTGKEPTEESRK